MAARRQARALVVTKVVHGLTLGVAHEQSGRPTLAGVANDGVDEVRGNHNVLL